MTTKRIVDLFGSVCGLLLIAPLTPLIALAIKLDSRGPVIVKIKRVSRGQTFYLYKFRTMVADAEKLKPLLQHLNERGDGPFFKIRNDPRLTKMGRWLRRFRFDEFPQLINVLKNEMALVGPRPYTPEEIVAYPEEYKHLPLVKGGVTGLSQVHGSSTLTFKETLALDDFYVKNQSLALDLKIIVKTLLIIFFDHNAV